MQRKCCAGENTAQGHHQIELMELLHSCVPANGAYPHPQRLLNTRKHMNPYLRYPRTSRLNT